MAQNEKKPLNEKIAKALWGLVTVELVKFRAVIRRHANHDFYGYAYVQIGLSLKPIIDMVAKLPGSGPLVKLLTHWNKDVAGAFRFGLTNLEVKRLPKAGFFVGMREERGTDGKYRPNFFPLSPEFRLVLTTAIQNNVEVKAAVEACAKLAKPTSKTTATEAGADDSPLNGEDAELEAGADESASAGESPFAD